MAQPLRREFTAREFNRDPSAVARAAHRFGQVIITNRGTPTLLITDADRTDLMPAVAAPSLLEAFRGPDGIDEDAVGEPERAAIIARIPD